MRRVLLCLVCSVVWSLNGCGPSGTPIVVENCEKAKECGALTDTVGECVERTEASRETLARKPECGELLQAVDAFIACTARRTCEELAIPVRNGTSPCYDEAIAVDAAGEKCNPLQAL